MNKPALSVLSIDSEGKLTEPIAEFQNEKAAFIYNAVVDVGEPYDSLENRFEFVFNPYHTSIQRNGSKW